MVNEIKIFCNKCKNKAVWCYMPRVGGYYCEEHISRGCSCNVIGFALEDTEQFKDEQGRLLPCCEYDYCEEGFNAEDCIEDLDSCVDDYLDDELSLYDFSYEK